MFPQTLPPAVPTVDMVGKSLCLVYVMIAISSPQFLLSNPCTEKITCGECLLTESCSWCMAPDYDHSDGSPAPRCSMAGTRPGIRCPAEHVLDQDKGCSCEEPGNDGYEEKSPHCNGVGTHRCGICSCGEDYFGRNCECEANNFYFGFDPESGCKADRNSPVCSNRGNCVCGMCACFPRQDREEIVSGEYCECDNYSCDRYNGLLCSGEDHGECVCGRCQCKSDWDVKGYSACECRAGNSTCITPYGEHIGKICSGHGRCQCGECKCEESEDGVYSGEYCEVCPTCQGSCEELQSCVECSGDDCLLCPFKPMIVNQVEKYLEKDERLCTFIDDDDCIVQFVYGNKRSTGELQVWVEETKECPVMAEKHSDEGSGAALGNIMSTICNAVLFIATIF